MNTEKKIYNEPEDYWIEHPDQFRAIYNALGNLKKFPTARDLVDAFQTVVLPKPVHPVLAAKWERLGNVLTVVALQRSPSHFDEYVHDQHLADKYNSMIREARTVLDEIFYNPTNF